MPLGNEVGLGPGHIVLDGDPVGTGDPAPHSSPSPVSAHAYCGQTVAQKLPRKISWLLFMADGVQTV